MDENIIFVCSSTESSIVLLSRRDEFLIKDIHASVDCVILTDTYMFKKERKDKKSKAGRKENGQEECIAG
jgi:hypothetical protein